MRTSIVLTVALAAGVLAPAAVAGDYYRWKDDNGVLHYDPAPPKDHPSTLVHISGKVPEAAPVDAAKADAAKSDPNPSDPAAKVKAATEVINAENCRIVTANLANLEKKGPVTSRGADGIDRVMTQEERDAAYKEALRQRDEFCSKK